MSVIQGDTRSLDHSSCDVATSWMTANFPSAIQAGSMDVPIPIRRATKYLKSSWLRILRFRVFVAQTPYKK